MATHEVELKDLLKKDQVALDGASNGTEVKLSATDVHTLLGSNQVTATSTDKTLQEQDSLKQLTTMQAQLAGIQKDLKNLIRCIAENPSMISQAAIAWEKLTLWQKVLGGVIVALPTIFVGGLFSGGGSLVLGSASAMTYVTGAAVLEDHNFYNSKNIKRIELSVDKLATMLEDIITMLATVHSKFSDEITKVSAENVRLVKNVEELSGQIGNLSREIGGLIEAEKLLKQEVADLQVKKQELSAVCAQNIELQGDLKKTQKQLEEKTSAHAAISQKLHAEIAELAATRTSLNLELTNAKLVANTLGGAVKTFINTATEDKQQRADFQAKLTSFLANEKANFGQFADRICQAERDLYETKEQLRAANELHKTYLDRHDEILNRLDVLLVRGPNEDAASTMTVGEIIGKIGVFGKAPNPLPTYTDSPEIKLI